MGKTKTYGKLWLHRAVESEANGKDEYEWCLEGEPHLILKIRRVFRRVGNYQTETLTFKNTDEICRDLQWFISRYPLQMKPKDRTKLHQWAHRHKDTITRLDKLIDKNYTGRTFKMALPPREYQKIAAELFLKRGFLLLADDVGTGKTVTAITALTYKKTLPAVIVTPAGTMPFQWEEMAHKFLPGVTTHVAKKGTSYELPKKDGRGPDLVILNYHKLSGWAHTLAPYANTVIFDECQELRRSGSQKYNAAVQIARDMKWALGLSATPIFNYGSEIWTVINVLKEDVLGTDAEFIREWCSSSGYGRRNSIPVRDPKALGSYLRAEHIMLRRTRRDVGRELPKLQKIPQFVESDEKALDAVKASAGELAKIILSNEKTSGWERLQATEKFDMVLRQATGVAKAPYVADFIRLLVENGEQVLVFAWHRTVYSILQSKLEDLKPLMFTGSETAARKQEAKKSFEEGESQILLMSLRAAQGLDGLQEICRTVVFAELDWSPGVHEQCIGRILRDGQKDPVTAFYLVSDKGSDPTIAELIGVKTSQIEGLKDPSGELLEKLQTSENRVKELARQYLKKLEKKKRTQEVNNV